MKSKSALLLFLLGASLLAFVPNRACASLAPSSAQATPQTSSSRTNDMTLDVVVTDKAGRPVRGLDHQDFKVLDNKTPRTIGSFHAVAGESVHPDPPVEAYLLVDMINPSFVTIANERRNLIAYLKGTGAHLALPTSFVFLTDQGIKVQGQSTRDASVLLSNLDANPTVQPATLPTAGYNRMMEVRLKSLQGLDILAVDLARKPGRKLVLWLSQGWPAFVVESNQMSSKEAQQLFTYIVSLSTVLRRADITLYAVDPSGSSSNLFGEGGNNFKYQDFVKGVTSQKQVDNGDLLLQVIATQTGGKVLFGSNDIARLIDQCVSDAGSFYELRFDAPHATHADEYHAIQIEMAKKGLKARTITGYYAQP